jgi:GT2 family glycosyltransferase
MPFAGSEQAALAAVGALRTLDAAPGDELILVDNVGLADDLPDRSDAPGIEVVHAGAERSPAHARNAGAQQASREWILFLDADCLPRSGLLEAYFASPIADDVGALAGQIMPASGGGGMVSRYGASRSFLDQEAHLAHPYRPRAAAANLLVRRRAFEQVGRFFEGVRAGEDTDFSWRLQQAGWRLELRPEAWVRHTYRASLGDLRRQWRGYAAGRAWLARRYVDFHPQPAVVRALRRRSARSEPTRAGGSENRLDRAAFLAIDTLLSLEELAGFALSNRPAGTASEASSPSVVLLADSFPAAEDPLVELAAALDQVRVEAVRRPERLDATGAQSVQVSYLEDEGAAARWLALIWVLARHPFRSGFDVAAHRHRRPPLSALAPAVRRLERDSGARVMALGPSGARTTAARIARLAGRKLDEMPRATAGSPVRRLRARRS